MNNNMNNDFNELLNDINDQTIDVYLPFKNTNIKIKPLSYGFFDPIVKIIRDTEKFDNACYIKIYNHVTNQIKKLTEENLNYFDMISIMMHLLKEVKSEVVIDKDNIVECEKVLNQYLSNFEKIQTYINNPYTFKIQDTEFELTYKVPEIKYINVDDETHIHVTSEIQKFASTLTIKKGDKQATSNINDIINNNNILNLPANLVSNILNGVLKYKTFINDCINGFNPVEDIGLIMYFVDTD